ncbi:MAG: DUF7093 family protein [Halobacteriota archaeon]
MGIRCSLTGHSWSDVRSRRSTEESRGEVAVTEVEYRVCERCGEHRTVSENTEVRSTEPEGGSDGDRRAETTSGDSATESSSGGRREADVTTDAPPSRSDDAVVVENQAPAGDADPLYRCPECGFGSADTSLREGDVCPECGGGYLGRA